MWTEILSWIFASISIGSGYGYSKNGVLGLAQLEYELGILCTLYHYKPPSLRQNMLIYLFRLTFYCSCIKWRTFREDWLSHDKWVERNTSIGTNLIKWINGNWRYLLAKLSSNNSSDVDSGCMTCDCTDV